MVWSYYQQQRLGGDFLALRITVPSEDIDVAAVFLDTWRFINVDGVSQEVAVEVIFLAQTVKLHLIRSHDRYPRPGLITISRLERRIFGGIVIYGGHRTAYCT